MAKKRAGWTMDEESAVIDLYNKMLKMQAAGSLGPAKSRGQTSKAVLVREFIADYAPTRSRPSVEMKLMNVSYCRLLAGLPTVTGYKPLPNCSDGLLKAFDVERKKGGGE